MTAILNDKAIIDGQTVAAGDRIQKATVESIGIDNIVLEMDGGATRTIKIFSEANMQAMPQKNPSNGLGQEQGKDGRPSGRNNNKHKRRQMMQQQPPPGMMPAQKPPSSSNQELPPGFDKIPAEYRAKALEKWNSMSEEEKNQIRQHSQ